MVDKYTGTGAAVGGGFTGGDPGMGIPASPWPAAHANLLTEELRNLVVAAGLVPSYADATQVSKAVQAIVQGVPALKNYLINGNFDVWQRGTGFGVTTTPKYTADRWRALADGPAGAGSMSVAISLLAPGDPGLPRGSRFIASLTQSAAATVAPPQFSQRVTQLERFSSRPVCLSMYLRGLAPAAGTLRLVANYGVGGSAPEAIASQAIAIGTSWTRFNVAGTFPSVFGKTNGTGDYLDCVLELPTGVTFVIGVSHAQLEEGLVPTVFEPRDRVLERQLCYEYYEQSYREGQAPGGITNLGAVLFHTGTGSLRPGIDTRFRAAKRVNPAVTYFDPESGAAGFIRDITQAVTRAVATSANVSTERTGWVTTAGSEGNYSAHWTADAEI